jgi:hypothetical protein
MMKIGLLSITAIKSGYITTHIYDKPNEALSCTESLQQIDIEMIEM